MTPAEKELRADADRMETRAYIIERGVSKFLRNYRNSSVELGVCVSALSEAVLLREQTEAISEQLHHPAKLLRETSKRNPRKVKK